MEIGPRFVLNLIKIFQGSFGGPTLYENPGFKSPNMVNCLFLMHRSGWLWPLPIQQHRSNQAFFSFFSHLQHRREIRLAAAARVREKQMVKEMQKTKRTEAKQDLEKDVTADVFFTPAEEKPVVIETEAPEPKVVKRNKHKAFKRQRMVHR